MNFYLRFLGAIRSIKTTTLSKGIRAVFSNLVKAAMAVVTLLYVANSFELEKIYAVVAIYAIFCLSSVLEVLLVTRPMSKGGDGMAISPPPDLSTLSNGVQKVLEYQDTQIKALDYIVGFIRSSQATRDPS